MLLVAAFCFSCFCFLAFLRSPAHGQVNYFVSQGRVVLDSSVLAMLYGGDRYLAANLEVIRLAATGVDQGVANSEYLVRAQHVVSKLNSCHEDNYYLANGLLTWGGAVVEGNDILLAAIDCRFWDGAPGFFYGVNLSFFEKKFDAAALVLEESAERWPENAAALRKLAVMLRVEAFSDEHLALGYLTQQRDAARDPALRGMLDKRVIRLQRLIDLRVAQRRYEGSHGALTDLNDLVSSGELDALPQDPLNLGYELRNGRIELGKLKIVGMEEQP